MPKRALLLALTTCTLGCMASMTPEGAAVRPMTASQKDRDCKFLSLVTASEDMGSSTAGDAQSALNKARNKVAAAGGNAMLIVSTSSDNNASTVIVEALKCTFAIDSTAATTDGAGASSPVG